MARPSFDRAYALRDRVTDREKHFIAAEYFSARQQFEQTRDSLKALTTLYPDDPEFRYELAIAHYALEEVAPAIAQLRESIRLSPHFARAHGALVLLLARNNQPQAALEASAEAAKAGGEFHLYGCEVWRSRGHGTWRARGVISRTCPEHPGITLISVASRPRGCASTREISTARSTIWLRLST